jgi:serine/threonine protein kinase
VIREFQGEGDDTVNHNGGTRAYLAPEIVSTPKGVKRQFTKKADVFAAGIVFLELVTLKSPRGLYASSWPGVLKEENDGMDESIGLALTKSLDVDPANRYSFTELLSVLNRDQIEKV